MAEDATDQGYLLKNAQPETGTRFGALAELFDPVTFRHVDALGIGPGMRCWEVGAGGPSVPLGLAERVGPTGSVVATDIDTAWNRDIANGVIEVLTHDVAADPPPPGSFDLVHARLVLVHVADRAEALRRMVQALRPGGWLLLEDAYLMPQPPLCPDEFGPEERLTEQLHNGFRTLMAGRGADLSFGRNLPRTLRQAGLDDVRADAYFPIALPACTVLEDATVRQVRHLLTEHGLATDEEIDRHLANVATGRLDLPTPPMVSAWGRRP
ncbi:class I SAM-dependent methyltransferase [Streptomyces palmae]|uniref:Methyltransferase domain-containing protein n=1 Tax=Streptomyces palmae TaxID=1701085 RepID=A0A4Z0GM25_9ACTN|nr:methyltransferase domain-containing protein [Streptomyces palmae]TGA98055.1 methyltransferase domain-containing protein [Streptomyces palmae]